MLLLTPKMDEVRNSVIKRVQNMREKTIKMLLYCLSISFGFSFYLSAQEIEKSMVLVKGGSYEPFFKDTALSTSTVILADLWVDANPVTNEEFLAFVKKQSDWQRDRVPRIFADSFYLSHWPEAKAVKAEDLKKPVVFVSWFAATAYCKSQGKRLLDINEWEYVADAGSEQSQSLIMNWYGKPSTEPLSAVGSLIKNKNGVFGMHGLIWEWVYDFNSIIIKSDSRQSNDKELKFFCGSGSLNALAPEEYATFMRFAFRSGLKGQYSVGNLGFRCAKSLK